jgi:hypothetical protein
VLITTDCVEIPEPAGALSMLIGAALACGLGRFLRNSI